jgi:hypothetical protein
MSIQGIPSEIKIPALWNLIGRSVTAPLSVIAQQHSSVAIVSFRFQSRQ